MSRSRPLERFSPGPPTRAARHTRSPPPRDPSGPRLSEHLLPPVRGLVRIHCTGRARWAGLQAATFPAGYRISRSAHPWWFPRGRRLSGGEIQPPDAPSGSRMQRATTARSDGVQIRGRRGGRPCQGSTRRGMRSSKAANRSGAGGRSHSWQGSTASRLSSPGGAAEFIATGF